MFSGTGLRFRILEAALINKGFVKNEEKCNYELYLVEMLNQSVWFSSNFSNKFEWSNSQSRGECDAYSGGYGLDFKLIASTTELLARNVHSFQISKERNGIVRYFGPRANQKPTTVTHLFFVLKDCSVEDLEKIRNTKTRKYCMEKDVRNFLSLLETKKNLLLFFCYRFYFDKDNKLENATEIIRWYLQKWYKSSFEYRKKYCPEFDTFLVTLYYNDFVLMKVTGNKLEVVEVIPVEKSPTYMLLQGYDPWK